MKITMTGRDYTKLHAIAHDFAIGQTGDLAVATIAPWAVVLTIVPEHHAFDGGQVWCASISRRGMTNRAVAPTKWSEIQIYKAQQILDDVLFGVGDPQRARCLTTNGAMYVQRALVDEEIDSRMSPITQDAMLPLGPLTIVWAKGLPDRASALPCEAPVHRPMIARGPIFAVDCGECIPCRARTWVRQHQQPCRKSYADFKGELS